MISVVIGERRIRLSGNRFSPALQVFFLSETCLKGNSLREKKRPQRFQKLLQGFDFFFFSPKSPLEVHREVTRAKGDTLICSDQVQ